MKCFFIDPHSYHNFFNRGVFYGHHDDAERYAFFFRAALEVIHCHDWQTGTDYLNIYDYIREK